MYTPSEYPVLYEDMNFLSEIYSLNEIHFDIVRENIRTIHAYRTIGDPEILTECTLDMFGKMGEFFKKMIDKIKEFFKKILMYVSAHFMEIDKFVKKYKNELDKVKKVDFDIFGYEFTIKNGPDLSPFQDLVNSYNSTISDITKVKSKEINDEEFQKMSDDNLDQVRGTVLGAGKPIKEDDFLETARKYYRNGETETISIHVDESLFRSTVNQVEDLVKRKKDAEQLRDKLIVLLSKTEDFFNKKVSSVYVDKAKKIPMKKLDIKDNKFGTEKEEYHNYTHAAEFNLNKFIQYKYNYCRKVASIVNLVASEYCNAYKDNVKMSREIIVKSLYGKNDDSDDTNKED